ncbi:MAG: DUF6531 domain-containing protein [Nocardioides sp.]
MSPCIESCVPKAVSSLVPVFTGTSTDADSPTIAYVVEFRVSGTSTTIGSATGPSVTQGTPGSVAAPAGLLSDGVIYQYRLGATDGALTAFGAWTKFQTKVGTDTPVYWDSSLALTADATWGPNGSPYVLQASLTVPAGITFTVKPGTVIKSDGGQIGVRGRLLSKGTAEAPIYYTSIEDDSVGGDSGLDGPTQGSPGDYATILRFNPTVDEASESKTSIITNSSFRYGGWYSPVRCYLSEMVSLEGEARVSIDHSEFTDSLIAGITLAAGSKGLGSVSISHSLFERNGACGINTTSSQGRAEIRANLFADTWPYPIYSLGNPGHGISVTENWFYGKLFHFTNFDPITPDTISYKHNAFMGSWVNSSWVGGYYDPEDLSDNYWPVNFEPPHCVDPDVVLYLIPPVDTRTNLGCDDNTEAYKYFTTVTPLSDPPPVVPVGLEGSPVLPVAVPPGQVLGNGDSEFAINPSGYQVDPVNTVNGSYVETVVDASMPTLGGDLTLDRTYNSADETTGPLGQGWSTGLAPRLSFPDTDVVMLTGSDGQQAVFRWDDDESEYLPDPGVTAHLVETSGGAFEVTTKDDLTYDFHSDGRVDEVVDANGNAIEFGYDSGHLSEVSVGARSFELSWSGGKITSVELPDGREVDYGYTNGQLTSVTDLAGETTTYTYDQDGRLLTKTDPLGHTQLELAYDAQTGRVSQQTNAVGKVSTFDWDPGTGDGTGTATLTDPRGGEWRDVYRGYQLIERTDPLGHTWSYEYDANQRMVATEDPRGFRSTFVWDGDNHLASSTTPTGTVVNAYDSAGNLTRTWDARGTLTAQDFDTHHNVVSIEQHGAPSDTTRVTTFTYDTAGFATSTTAPSGATTTRTRTANGDLATITTPEGNTTEMTYDSVGRMVELTTPRGTETPTPGDFTTTYTYDDADRVTQIEDPLGRTVEYTYDAAGRLTTSEDRSGHVTETTYRNDNQPSAVQGPDSSISPTTYTYDNSGNLKTLTDPSGRVETYTYDAANQLIGRDGPAGTFTYTRNANGDIASETRPGNQTVNYRYNPAGQIRLIDYPTGTTDVSFTYDANGNRKTMAQGSTTTNYTYDRFNELTQAKTGTATYSYTYDLDGRLASTTAPTTTVTGYTYDDDGRLHQAKRNGTTQATYDYDPDGHLAQAALADGSTRAYTYDPGGRVTRLTDTAPGSREIIDDQITYDDNDNPTSIEHADSTTDTYTYDDLDRLTGVCYDTASCDGTATDYVRWTYDPVGNRTSEERPTGTTTYTRATGTGRLTSTTAPGPVTTNYTYDAQGRLTSDGTTTYTYNAANQLTTEQASGQPVTTYTYDGDGRRTKAVTDSVTTNYLWDPLSYQLAAQTDQTGTTQAEITYGLGPVAQYNSTTATYLHQDLQKLRGRNHRQHRRGDQHLHLRALRPHPHQRHHSRTGTTPPLGWSVPRHVRGLPPQGTPIPTRPRLLRRPRPSTRRPRLSHLHLRRRQPHGQRRPHRTLAILRRLRLGHRQLHRPEHHRHQPRRPSTPSLQRMHQRNQRLLRPRRRRHGHHRRRRHPRRTRHHNRRKGPGRQRRAGPWWNQHG